MGEIIGSVICAGVLGLIVGVWSLYLSRKKQKERSKYTLEEIAQKWHLWDEFVNCYYESQREQVRNSIGKTPNIKELVREDGILADEMDYEIFYKTPLEIKLSMLETTFPEQKNR